jgi:hypothetical protein
MLYVNISGFCIPLLLNWGSYFESFPFRFQLQGLYPLPSQTCPNKNFKNLVEKQWDQPESNYNHPASQIRHLQMKCASRNWNNQHKHLKQHTQHDGTG